MHRRRSDWAVLVGLVLAFLLIWTAKGVYAAGEFVGSHHFVVRVFSFEGEGTPGVRVTRIWTNSQREGQDQDLELPELYVERVDFEAWEAAQEREEAMRREMEGGTEEACGSLQMPQNRYLDRLIGGMAQ